MVPSPARADAAQPPEAFLQLLHALAARTGLAEPLAGEDGICTLVLNQNMPVNLACDAQGSWLTLFAPLGDVPEAAQAHWHRHMLSAGYFPEGQPVCFAREPGTGRIAMATAAPLHTLDADLLMALLDDFGSLLRQWRTALAETAQADAHAAAPDRGQAPPAFWLRG